MQPWISRVVEEANLFNPAFCATLMAKTVDEYQKKAQHHFPFSLAFLVLPVVLHRATRESLPGSTITSLLVLQLRIWAAAIVAEGCGRLMTSSP